MSLPTESIPRAGTPQGDEQCSPPTTTTSSSSGGKTSAFQATTASSIDSSGLNSQYEDDVGVGEKRKRATRQQANTDGRQQAEDVQGVVRYKTPDQPIKRSQEISIRPVEDVDSDLNTKYDDKDGSYEVVYGADLAYDYKILRILGKGVFGQVVKALDKRSNKLVAIKILNCGEEFRQAARHELKVLATLRANDRENINRCIHFRDCFDYRDHVCIVMDLHPTSLYDFLVENYRIPFPNSQIQSFAKQLFKSVAFLYDLDLIHTDLKPHNILLCNSNCDMLTYNQKIPSSCSASVSRSPSFRKVLRDTEIRLIDFGCATFNDMYHPATITTQQYRAPEVILGLVWSFECDIWSIGCILVELFTGAYLFPRRHLVDHLAMVETVVGASMKKVFGEQLELMTTGGRILAEEHFKRYEEGQPTPNTGKKQLKAIIPTDTPFLETFLDLLEKIFVYDPEQRITAKQALSHPWFQQAATADNGTSAGASSGNRE